MVLMYLACIRRTSSALNSTSALVSQCCRAAFKHPGLPRGAPAMRKRVRESRVVSCFHALKILGSVTAAGRAASGRTMHRTEQVLL